jgi:hypothetical protein
MVGVAALDAHPGLVRGHHRGPAQRRARGFTAFHEPTLRPPQQVHQPALAQGEPEQVGQRRLQPFVGEGLEGFQVGGHCM